MKEKEIKQVMKQLRENHKIGVKHFRARYDKKEYKKYQKLLKKPEYIEYQYEALPKCFTKRTDFYYNLDSTLAKLLVDLLTNYRCIASEIIDMSEHDFDKKLDCIIKFFKKYNKIDKLKLVGNTKSAKKFKDDMEQAFDYFREIFQKLWY